MRYTLLLVLHATSHLSNALQGHWASDGHLRSGHQIIFQDEFYNGPQSYPSPVAPPVRNATKSFWLRPNDNPLADEGSRRSLTKEADICIIGSGITGVSAAWHLSRYLRGHKYNASVVVLEAREFCSGATGRNGGHLRPRAFSGFRSRQARYNTSEAIKSYTIEEYTANALVKFLKEKNLGDAVDLFEGGHVILFRTQEEELDSRRDFAAATTAGLNLSTVRWISNHELIEQYGLNPDLRYTAVRVPGHNIWPCKLVTELYKDAQASSSNVSINLYTHTPVSSITRRSFPGGRPWALHTPRGRVKCTYVIHATNAYAGHLLPIFASSIGIQRSPLPGLADDLTTKYAGPTGFGITPTRGQVGAVRASVPVSGMRWQNGWGGGGGWEYWFPRFQGLNNTEQEAPLIILGGGREFSGGTLEVGVSDDATLNERVSKALRAFLPRYFPSMFNESDKWTMEWTGIMGFTKSGDPFVGPVPDPDHYNYYEGQYIAAGYTGHGMVRAYACAEVVASMIAAQIMGSRWTIPDWLPERYLTWVTHSR